MKAKVAKGRKLFVPYLTAGLPSPQAFIDLFSELSWCADAIEVGVPFSDPIMDGPIIQESSQRALALGVTLPSCLKLVAEALRESSVPAVVMTYFNPVHHLTIPKFAATMSDAGIQGVIVPDLPFEESGDLDSALRRKSIAHIQMIAPSTPPERAAMLAKKSQGWIYAVSRLGVTGEQIELAAAAEEVVAKIKHHASAPVLLGIGISSGDQAAQAAIYADGVIVGSAIVKLVLAGDLDGAVALSKQIRVSLDSVTP
ncbi:MAG: tryptophan synthase subunit alpha [Actinomycetota bacterium]